jgi:hypothetical protein
MQLQSRFDNVQIAVSLELTHGRAWRDKSCEAVYSQVRFSSARMSWACIDVMRSMRSTPGWIMA